MGQDNLEKVGLLVVEALKRFGTDSILLCQSVNDLVRYPYDAVTYDYNDDVETRKYRVGGRKGKVVATVVIRYTDNTRTLIESRELKDAKA